MRRKTIVVLLVTVLAASIMLLSSCGGRSMKGTWVTPESTESAPIELGSKTFNSKGLSFPGATLDGASGTYEVEDDSLIVTFSDGTVMEYPMEKINGVWAIHANYFNPDMVYVKEGDVDKYLKGKE